MPTRILAPARSLRFAEPGLSGMSHLGKSVKTTNLFLSSEILLHRSRGYYNHVVSLSIDLVRPARKATDRARFKYSHGCAIILTARGLSAYTLYNMTFDAELKVTGATERPTIAELLASMSICNLSLKNWYEAFAMACCLP
jgi:hypothetical protein